MNSSRPLSSPPPGLTLLELTVVILVLLSLIIVLFIGASAWKKGADRAACLLNIRNIQQSVRSYANIHSINPNTNVPGLRSLVIGPGKFVESEPICPAGKSDYAAADENRIPDLGVLYATCPNVATFPDHTLGGRPDW